MLFMKQIILLLLLFYGYCSPAQEMQAQEKYDTFITDTTVYLRDSIAGKRAYYVGKPLQTLFDNLWLPINAIARLMAGFHHVFSLKMYNALAGMQRVKYLFNNRLLLALTVMGLYVWVSVVLDNSFFGYKYPTVLSHIIQRLTRVLPYVVIAAVYTYFSYYQQRVMGYMKKNQQRFSMLNYDLDKIKERIKVLEEEEKLLN
jgi:hypothetical protein